mgnify:CR=1 FL=1
MYEPIGWYNARRKMSRARAPLTRYLWGETRLLMDYIKAVYPPPGVFTNVKVGPLDPHVPRDGLTGAQQRLMGSFRRYADAIVVRPDEPVVIETTMVKAVTKVGPLLEYLKLVPQTPELAQYMPRRVRGELVSPIPDPRTEELCKDLGLRFVVYEVDWLDKFMEQYGARFRMAPLSGLRQEFVNSRVSRLL